MAINKIGMMGGEPKKASLGNQKLRRMSYRQKL
jgi:hypothetical protein